MIEAIAVAIAIVFLCELRHERQRTEWLERDNKERLDRIIAKLRRR